MAKNGGKIFRSRSVYNEETKDVIQYIHTYMDSYVNYIHPPTHTHTYVWSLETMNERKITYETHTHTHCEQE